VISATRLRALVINLPRDFPAAASIAARHIGRDRTYASLVALRTLPAAVRRLLADHLAGSARPAALLVMAADGRRDQALGALDDVIDAVPPAPRRLRRLAAVAAALDAPEQATRLITQLPPTDPQRLRLAALAAASDGDLTRASQLAQQSGWRADLLRRQIAGELTVLAGPRANLPRAGGPLVVRPDVVLHLVTNALPEVTAGYTVRTQGIVAAQRDLGLDAHVCTRLGFPVTAGHFGAGRTAWVRGVPYHRMVPFRWLPSASDRALTVDIEQTAKLVTRLRPAVLHAHSKHLNAQVALALRDRFELPVVYEVRGFLEETWRSHGHDSTSDRYQLAREAETRCMLAANAVVTLGQGMKSEIVRRGVDPARIVVVPNAVDNVFLEPVPAPEGIRRRLGFDDDDVVLGVVSTINDYEGISVLVDALARLRDRGSPARALVVGGGPALNSLRRRAADLGLDKAAIFTGPVPYSGVRHYYAAIDVFCVPRADTPVTRLVTPLKPLEAMATGRPVVASDLPPLREIVTPGQTGVLATAGNPESLVEATEPLLFDPAERKRMGANARQWVADHRTWDSAARTYRDLYRTLGAT
jgi:glycosyltransferase involved in cell wall biosynthesis